MKETVQKDAQKKEKKKEREEEKVGKNEERK